MLFPTDLLVHTGACPAAFTASQITIGAISDSRELSICADSAKAVTGVNGSVTFVLNSNTAPAPRCLIYPNGLNPDLTYSLLSSGHVGCWSLYPPSQPIVISNVGRPNGSKLQEVLRKFHPTKPTIYYSPKEKLQLGDKIAFSSSAKQELIDTVLLNLPCQVRFKPVTYTWLFDDKKSSSSKPSFVVTSSGEVIATLSVSFSVEYSFPRLTTWQMVKPNIISNADPVRITIGSVKEPVTRKPRLVLKDCLLAPRWGC